MVSPTRRKQYHLLIDITFSCNLTQFVRNPTGSTSACESLLDLVFVSSMIAGQGARCEILERVSDHSLVSCTLTLACKPSATTDVKHFHDFSRTNDVDILETLEERFSQFYVMFKTANCSTNDLWSRFRFTVEYSVERHVPLRVKKAQPVDHKLYSSFETQTTSSSQIL